MTLFAGMFGSTAASSAQSYLYPDESIAQVIFKPRPLFEMQEYNPISSGHQSLRSSQRRIKLDLKHYWEQSEKTGVADELLYGFKSAILEAAAWAEGVSWVRKSALQPRGTPYGK